LANSLCICCTHALPRLSVCAPQTTEVSHVCVSAAKHMLAFPILPSWVPS
jgi:hypothetical protein